MLKMLELVLVVVVDFVKEPIESMSPYLQEVLESSMGRLGKSRRTAANIAIMAGKADSPLLPNRILLLFEIQE